MHGAGAVNLECKATDRFDINPTIRAHCQPGVVKFNGKVGEMNFAACIAANRDGSGVMRCRADNFAAIGSARDLADDEGHWPAPTSRRRR